MNFAKAMTIVRKLEDKKSNQVGNNMCSGTFYEVGSRFYRSN
jgi:hypothetical protein